MNILLVEPSYKNKYPPLGLMKLAKFHKLRGDKVLFVKGLNRDARSANWDRVYITTLFSFYWATTIKTIKYYEFSVNNPQDLYIGGPMATILSDEIESETGFRVIKGLLNEPGKIGLPNDKEIDRIIPDYSILDEIDYKYPANNAYFTYATRGCIRKCKFCAVHKIEPSYNSYIPLKKQIMMIDKEYGQRKDLLLLDNNVLASDDFDRIIDEIKDIGFIRGAKLKNKLRYVDFNQGVDHRLLTKKRMKKLAEIPIRPLRIAFDRIQYKEAYIKCIEWAAEYGLFNLSNYILYNFKDTPEELYERLRINVELNNKLGTQIYSFPMKYVPTTAHDRSFVGVHWNPKYLRAIQCILNATHGLVGPRLEFFNAAFGKNVREYKKLLILPEKYIIYRNEHASNGASKWHEEYKRLSRKQKAEFENIISSNKFNGNTNNPIVNSLLSHYVT